MTLARSCQPLKELNTARHRSELTCSCCRKAAETQRPTANLPYSHQSAENTQQEQQAPELAATSLFLPLNPPTTGNAYIHARDTHHTLMHATGPHHRRSAAPLTSSAANLGLVRGLLSAGAAGWSRRA
jgi:hypothetical protein